MRRISGLILSPLRPRFFGLRPQNDSKVQVPPSLRSVRDDRQRQPQAPPPPGMLRDRFARSGRQRRLCHPERTRGISGFILSPLRPRFFGLRPQNDSKGRSLRRCAPFGTTGEGFGHPEARHTKKSGESPAVAGNSPLLNGLFLWSVSILNT